jgi:hypothetical protein
MGKTRVMVAASLASVGIALGVATTPASADAWRLEYTFGSYPTWEKNLVLCASAGGQGVDSGAWRIWQCRHAGAAGHLAQLWVQ